MFHDLSSLKGCDDCSFPTRCRLDIDIVTGPGKISSVSVSITAGSWWIGRSHAELGIVIGARQIHYRSRSGRIGKEACISF